MPADVALAETFIETDWSRYSIPQANTDANGLGREPSNDGTYPWGLSTLNHIDVRPFNTLPAGNAHSKWALDTPENWVFSGNTTSTITLGPNSSFNNWKMLHLVFGATSPMTMTSVAQTLDLTQIDGGILQCSFASGAINTSTSYIDLSTDGFQTEIASVPFNASAQLGSGIVWIPISEWNTIDLTQVNGVRLRFTVTSAAALNMSGLRVIDPNYMPSSLVFDNWNGVLHQDIPFDAGTSEVPVPANRQMPPVNYAASTGQTDDPQPINSTFGIIFNTGGATGTNTLALNVRQIGGTDTSQLLLGSQTQYQLSSTTQPGITQTEEVPKLMSDYEGVLLSSLEGMTMLDMDAISETVTATWDTFLIQWGVTTQLTIGNSSAAFSNYQWQNLPTLSNFTNYLILCSITDNTVQMQMYNVDQVTLAQENLIYDTGALTDSYQFVRRPGRIGWQANFTDGGAYVMSIRPERLMFAEYQSVPMSSRNPVQGARLYATYATDIQLWTGFSAATVGPYRQQTATPTVTADTSRTITGSSTSVYISEALPNQGVISNTLSLDAYSGIMDSTQTTINFSVWFPSSSAMTNPLDAYLVSESGWYIPLSFPQISYDTWQPITFDCPSVPSGLYQLQIVYTGTQQTTFWVDQVSVSERALTWSARANSNDPWVPFNGLTNSDTNGVLVNRGTSLQVRAQARRQGSSISSKPKIVPNYAPLGRLVWPEDEQTAADTFTAPLTTLTSALTSGTHYSSSISVAPLGPAAVQSLLTPSGYQSFYLGTVLTINNGATQNSFVADPSSVTVGSTSITVLASHTFIPTINLPVGAAVTLMGAPFSYTNSSRAYTFNCNVMQTVSGSAFAYEDPYFNYVASWLWQFSDGALLSGPTVQHTFSSTAPVNTPYTVTLTLMDIYGGRSSNTQTVTVA